MQEQKGFEKLIFFSKNSLPALIIFVSANFMRELFALNIYFKRYAWQMLFGVLCIIGSNIVGVYVAVYVRQGLDEAVFYSSLPSSSVFFKHVLIATAGFASLVILVAAIKGVFMYLMRQSIVVVSRKVEYDLKNDIYSHYQQLGLDFYRSNFTGDMMARIGEDVGNVRMYIGPAVMYYVNMLFTFIVVIYRMLQVNAELTMYVLLPLPALSFGIYKVSNLINRRNTDIQNQLSVLTTAAQETFAGIRVIKSFGSEKHFLSDFNEMGRKYRHLNMRLALVNSLFFPLMVLLVGISSLLVLYLGGKETIAGRFSAGNIAEFMIYLNMLIWPVASLGWTTALVQKAAASQRRINDFLNHPVYTEPENAAKFVMEKGIFLRNVTFRYPKNVKDTLKNVTLSIPKGKIVGITGRTGSGKSTVAQLLTRQYDPTEGKLMVDDQSADDISKKDYFSHIAYIPQDVFLFSETVADNISFGSEKGDDRLDKIIESAAMAGLSADLERMPDGINTMLGERGVTLSGGQKQRVSIARALYREAQVYVFDDCLSAVDAKTEQEIIANFKNALTGKTALIISHRLAPLALCDYVYVLEGGTVAEEGTPSDLLKTDSRFAALSRLQKQD